MTWLCCIAPAAAEEGPGTAAVRKANADVAALLRRKAPPGSPAEKQLAREISARLAGFLDIDELGRRALADHWSSLTATQRRQYLSLLRTLVEANYLRALRANLDYEVVYHGEDVEDGTRRVRTELHLRRKGRPEVVSVDYLLQQQGDGWRAYDLITDGVGLVENYRAQFNQIFAKEGFDGLMQRMRKKQSQLGS